MAIERAELMTAIVATGGAFERARKASALGVLLHTTNRCQPPEGFPWLLLFLAIGIRYRFFDHNAGELIHEAAHR